MLPTVYVSTDCKYRRMTGQTTHEATIFANRSSESLEDIYNTNIGFPLRQNRYFIFVKANKYHSLDLEMFFTHNDYVSLFNSIWTNVAPNRAQFCHNCYVYAR